MKSKTANVFLLCGLIGPALFIVVFLIEGATRANYNPLRQPVSSLAIGEPGWMQSANFIISGLLILASAIGLGQVLRTSIRSVWGPGLIGLVAIGLIGAGIFTCDPMNGYPPGTPLVPAVRTINGRLHDLFSLPVFTALPAACFVFARRFAKSSQRGWAAYSICAGLGMFAFFVLAGMGFKQYQGFSDIAGVFQRLSIIVGLSWISILTYHFLIEPIRDPGKNK